MEIAVMHELHPEQTVSELAAALGYSPLFFINALAEAERMELLTRDKKKDMVMATIPVNYDTSMGLDFGKENTRLQNEILHTIADANSQNQDVEYGTLMIWCRGIKPSAIEISLHILKRLGFIVSYELTDPGDPKSKYEFLTLAINEGSEWGKKQFRKVTKK